MQQAFQRDQPPPGVEFTVCSGQLAEAHGCFGTCELPLKLPTVQLKHEAFGCLSQLLAYCLWILDSRLLATLVAMAHGAP
jgi:hypothetical protein